MIGRAHVFTQFIPFALQVLLQVSAACTRSDDLLYAAQGCRLDTACSHDMTSAAVPFLPSVLWQQAVNEDNSNTTCCIGLYANAVHACTASMQYSPYTLSHGTRFAGLPATTLATAHLQKFAAMYSRKNSAQAQVTL